MTSLPPIAHRMTRFFFYFLPSFLPPYLRGNLPPENIVPYVGNKMKYGSGVRIKGFTEGMWEIQNTPGVCSKLKVSAIISVVTVSVFCQWTDV